ncbi:MAG TPA: PFL family protein [Spirochaetota bacterium]|nr:PFL family protein [Spirochaetota bacterium]HPJ42921.1 PFL family protein [Spirochaetota bacterium]HRX47265.1 PFL family protein [Spirochaetota bacterium]
MKYEVSEILETIKMNALENLDVRTVTLGLSLFDCITDDAVKSAEKVREKMLRHGADIVKTADKIAGRYGVKIVNKRVSLTPLSLVFGRERSLEEYIKAADIIDKTGSEMGIDFIGGYSALVHKGITSGESAFLDSIPHVLASTQRLCSSVNVATTKAGINMDAVMRMGEIVKRAAELTADRQAIGCAKLVIFANIPEDNPFMAGALHGPGEGGATLNVGVSGPGVVYRAIKSLPPDADFEIVSETVKKIAFKITRMGELVGREVAKELGVSFGILDLSLAPTPAIGDSVADILEAMGLEACGTHGTTAALALLNDAVKKGGAFASSYVGGLSGAFIPVSEDSTMERRAAEGKLSLDKLEAMTAVCSVGLDMIAVPGDTPAETIAAIIADEISIGVINSKTTAVRLLPVPGAKPGDEITLGGLLGRARIIPVHRDSASVFVRRGGRIPAPIQSMKN